MLGRSLCAQVGHRLGWRRYSARFLSSMGYTQSGPCTYRLVWFDLGMK